MAAADASPPQALSIKIFKIFKIFKTFKIFKRPGFVTLIPGSIWFESDNVLDFGRSLVIPRSLARGISG